MKRTLALVAVAGVAALAQGQTTFMAADFQVYDAVGGTWGNLVEVTPGTPVSARVVISFGLASGVVDSWGGATLNQIDVSSSSAADAASGFGGLIRPTSQTFKLYNPGAANAKIDRLDNPAGQIQLAQLSSGNGGSTANPIIVYTFTYTPDAGNNAARDIGFNVTGSNFSLAQIFTTAGGSSASVPAGSRSWDGGIIRIVPAPGALALVGLSGLVAGRRRRA
jgi:hypothetical protein